MKDNTLRLVCCTTVKWVQYTQCLGKQNRCLGRTILYRCASWRVILNRISHLTGASRISHLTQRISPNFLWFSKSGWSVRGEMCDARCEMRRVRCAGWDALSEMRWVRCTQFASQFSTKCYASRNLPNFEIALAALILGISTSKRSPKLFRIVDLGLPDTIRPDLGPTVFILEAINCFAKFQKI